MNSGNNERSVIRVAAFEDLIDRIASFEDFNVAGRLYSSDQLIPALTINAADMVGEACSAAAWVMYWGLEASRARRFSAQVEASYRSWRDRTWLEIKATPAGETGKFPTDGQAEKIYRTKSEYGEWRGRLDDAQHVAELAEAVCEAFRAKVELVKTLERIMAHEAGGSYVVAVDPRQTIPRQPQQA